MSLLSKEYPLIDIKKNEQHLQPFVSLTKINFLGNQIGGCWSIRSLPVELRHLAYKCRPSDIFGEHVGHRRWHRPVARSELGHIRYRQISALETIDNNLIKEHIRIRLHQSARRGQYFAENIVHTLDDSQSLKQVEHIGSDTYHLVNSDDCQKSIVDENCIFPIVNETSSTKSVSCLKNFSLPSDSAELLITSEMAKDDMVVEYTPLSERSRIHHNIFDPKCVYLEPVTVLTSNQDAVTVAEVMQAPNDSINTCQIFSSDFRKQIAQTSQSDKKTVNDDDHLTCYSESNKRTRKRSSRNAKLFELSHNYQDVQDHLLRSMKVSKCLERDGSHTWSSLNDEQIATSSQTKRNFKVKPVFDAVISTKKKFKCKKVSDAKRKNNDKRLLGGMLKANFNLSKQKTRLHCAVKKSEFAIAGKMRMDDTKHSNANYKTKSENEVCLSLDSPHVAEESSVDALLCLAKQLNYAVGTSKSAKAENLFSVKKVKKKTKIILPSVGNADLHDDVLALELGPRFNWLENKIHGKLHLTSASAETNHVASSQQSEEERFDSTMNQQNDTFKTTKPDRTICGHLGHLQALGNEAVTEAAETLSLSSYVQKNSDINDNLSASGLSSCIMALTEDDKSDVIHNSNCPSVEHYLYSSSVHDRTTTDSVVANRTKIASNQSSQLKKLDMGYVYQESVDELNQNIGCQLNLVAPKFNAAESYHIDSIELDDTLPEAVEGSDIMKHQTDCNNSLYTDLQNRKQASVESVCELSEKIYDGDRKDDHYCAANAANNLQKYCVQALSSSTYQLYCSSSNSTICQHRTLLEAKREKLSAELNHINSVLAKSELDTTQVVKQVVAMSKPIKHTTVALNSTPAHNRQTSVKVVIRSAHPPMAHITKVDLTLYTFMHCNYDNGGSLNRFLCSKRCSLDEKKNTLVNSLNCHNELVYAEWKPKETLFSQHALSNQLSTLKMFENGSERQSGLKQSVTITDSGNLLHHHVSHGCRLQVSNSHSDSLKLMRQLSPFQSLTSEPSTNGEHCFQCTVCGNLALFVCSACKQVPYCSSECQAKSWQMGHSSVCCSST